MRCRPAVNPEYDIAILGGGLVGSSLACALDGRGYRVALIEGSPPRQAPPGFDDRKLALAAASLNALQALGVLPGAGEAPSPIRRIHVSREGDFGVVRMAAEDAGREYFGAVLPAHALGTALEHRLASLPEVDLLRPERLSAISALDAGWQLQLESDSGARSVSTRLLVAADGTRSFTRQALGIAVQEYDYGQTLLVCSASCERAADGTAYERFTDRGPVAFLPMGRNYGVICAVARAEAERVLALDDEAYAAYLQQRFGWRAGRIRRVGARSAYPIQRVLAEHLTATRAVLVGNAAQTIHPIGAQGFNLGLRDALTLAELLQGGVDPGSDAVLRDYEAARREDRERTLAFSDGLARATANPSFPMQVLRSLGLLGLGHVPGLSAPLAAGAMGFRGQVPTLARDRA